MNNALKESSLFFRFIETELLRLGVNEAIASLFQLIFDVCLVALLAYIVHLIAKKVIVRLVEKLVSKTKTRYDDFFVQRGVLRRIALYIPAIVIYASIDLIFADFPRVALLFNKAVLIWFVVIAVKIFCAALKALQDIYNQHDYSNDRPINGYVQGAQLIIILLSVLIIISILFNVQLTAIFAGLGAIAAVLILVFKDTILGFVASIQLSANKMVRIGDWIVLPSHQVDGTITEMTLNTVKIQNWDKTIATVPMYTLVSESFMNWRGMMESGGRRIKRSINIDMKTVTFCSDEMLNKLRRVSLLKAYIDEEMGKMSIINEGIERDTLSFDGRRLTNLGLFRKYLLCYLQKNPNIHNDMTFIVRHLQPTEKGIPMEIYIFSKLQNWESYEEVQADIFDHILAIMPEFGLQVYQFPTAAYLYPAE